MPSFDEALQRAGEFGRFQRRVFLLLCLTGVTFAFLFVGVVFLGSRPERYWCRGPSAAALAERCGWSAEEEWNRTAPPARRGDAGCRRYLLEAANGSAAAGALSCADPLAAFPNRSAPLVPCRGGWRYVQAHSTIVSEVRAPGLARGVWGGPTPRGAGTCWLPSGTRPGSSRARKRRAPRAREMPSASFAVLASGRGGVGGWGSGVGFGRERKPGRVRGSEMRRTHRLGDPSVRGAARGRPDGFAPRMETLGRLAVEKRSPAGRATRPGALGSPGGKGRAKRPRVAQMIL